MKKAELEQVHPLYKQNKDSWELYDLVYRSGKDLIEYALKQNPRESWKNWRARVDDGYVFNFGKAIIDLFHFCLSGKGVVRDIKGLEANPLWVKFQADSDLTGSNYDVLVSECQKFASIFGSMGILVNKPSMELRHMQDAIDQAIYPYISLYTPLAIRDWRFEKDPATHRNVLVYLKLQEANDDYLIWTPDTWEIWRVEGKAKVPKLIESGTNELGEIPFLWMHNLRDLTTPEIGLSDLVDIAHIVLSITQNLSSGEEIIKYAGFPILRKPMERETVGSPGDNEVPVAVTAVQQFDPTVGEAAKPDWMPTEIMEPITSILDWIDRKTDEIYRIAHLSGVHGQRKSNNEVASGMALRYEYDQLNSVLVAKANNQVEAEIGIVRLWLKWQNLSSLNDDISIKASKDFNIDDLSIELDNALKSMKAVISRTFRIRMQQHIAGHALPDLGQDDRDKINKEIESKTPEKAMWDLDVKMGDKVRSAVQARADHSMDDQPKPKDPDRKINPKSAQAD